MHPRSPFPGRLLLALLALAVVQAACGPRTGDIAPSLVPEADAMVWPTPPLRARYALAGSLIGEQNFVDPNERNKSTGRQVAEWIVGLIVGEPNYRELQRPVSGLTRPDGAVLVVDAGLKGVAIFDMAAKQFRIWDEPVKGESFASPIGIAPDGNSGWLVTDSELRRIFRLTADGAPGGLFSETRMSRPTGIARDPSTGRVFVADSALHEIRVFNEQGEPIQAIGGPGEQDGRFNAPTHLFWSDGELYVSDTLNFRIQVFDRDGTYKRSFGQVGLRIGDLFRPKGVAVGGEGRVYVVESYYDHLLVFAPDGQLLLPIGGTGKDIGRFYLPAGVWTDPVGRVYVADMFNGRVIVLAETGPLEDQG